MKKNLSKALPDKVKTMITYQGTKLSTKFNIKDQTKFHHKNNIVYYGKCPNENCKDDYVGETDRRSIERIIDHNKRDKKSHLLKHAQKENHTHVWEQNFKILGSNYQSNIKRKISESLFIRQLKPSLNKKEKSFPLHLYE